MARFEPVRKRARFNRSGFTDQQMLGVANRVTDSIKQRIHSGLDANDAPAPPLTEKYARKKQLFGGSGVRDWVSGRARMARTKKGSFPMGITLNSLRVLSYSANHAIIGFTNALANMRAAINNRRHRQFAVSPKDNQVFGSAVRDVRRAQKSSDTPARIA
jgi:uncharacterized membrane protein